MFDYDRRLCHFQFVVLKQIISSDQTIQTSVLDHNLCNFFFEDETIENVSDITISRNARKTRWNFRRPPLKFIDDDVCHHMIQVFSNMHGREQQYHRSLDADRQYFDVFVSRTMKDEISSISIAITQNS